MFPASWWVAGASAVIAAGLGWLYVGEIRDHTATKEAFEAFKREVNRVGRAAEKAAETTTAVIVERVEVGRKEDERKIAELSAALDTALRSLRVTGDHRDALKPADRAPAECRGYEADPRQLPLPHREFLVREAARGESVVLQRDACIREYNVVRDELEALRRASSSAAASRSQ